VSVKDKNMQISRRAKQAAVLLLGLAMTGCGYSDVPSQPSGKAATLNLSLKTVPTVRSITISPGTATFANCVGGSSGNNTASAGNRLGYPNGTCWVGEATPIGIYPIKITNTGIASFVYVSGSDAAPSDGGDHWSLCEAGANPQTSCSGHDKLLPGTDQYILRNFSPDGASGTGLSGTPECDHEFDQHGKCWAGQGASQDEGFELIGPFAATDSASTQWTMSITWTPVPTESG
jgi:hypothetical protein